MTDKTNDDTQVEETDTTDTTDTTTEMDAWTMATSILVGLHRAHQKARAEYAEARAGANGQPLANGSGKAMMIRDALADALATLEPDLHQVARANKLPMPEISKR